jgi:phosphatidylethanolamine/phosphatidyl-N-methylethanolamine N-methyltransferase
MKERVTLFPFNIIDNPMYIGSAMSFFGTSLWFGKPIGFILSLEVSIMYVFAMALEGPFTAKIYAMRDEYVLRQAAEKAVEKEE